MIGLLGLLFLGAIMFVPAESIVATTVIDTLNKNISIEKQDSGLTKFEAFGKSVDLDVQPLDYSKMND